jgi:ligand-binding SRPBCC domain-containing protein
MPRLELQNLIHAPVEVCFDLARDMDFHQRSLEHTGERIVAGVDRGLIDVRQVVTFEAKHFGVRQRFTAQLTEMTPPIYFRDVMIRGAFKRFEHEHIFARSPRGTVMTDKIDFASPFGPIGWVVDRLFMTIYLRRLLQHRADIIKLEAERRVAASDPSASPARSAATND